MSFSFIFLEIFTKLFLSYNVPISKRGLFELEHKKINDYSILEPS
jgi:hypothetical protein